MSSMASDFCFCLFTGYCSKSGTSGPKKEQNDTRLCVLQGSKFIFGFGSTCATRCNFLGAELKILGAQLQIPVVPTPKEYLTLQKEQLGLLVAIWAYSSSIEQNENKYFTQELSLDINY